MNIIDGRKTRDELLPALVSKISQLKAVPTLCIIQVGDRPDSTAFIKAKRNFAFKIGVKEKHVQLPETISEPELLRVIRENNSDKSVGGIILQLPIPLHIDRERAIDAIDPKKDVDCLTAQNVKAWLNGYGLLPATARGISELLSHYGISLAGKKVTVIGRSSLVGKPIAAMCLRENATVTICHSKTASLEKETVAADIIISASGKAGLIGASHVRPGQIIVDVGISKGEDGKLRGDVDFDSVKEIVAQITPVPGGVGPMTVFGLFENFIEMNA